MSVAATCRSRRGSLAKLDPQLGIWLSRNPCVSRHVGYETLLARLLRGGFLALDCERGTGALKSGARGVVGVGLSAHYRQKWVWRRLRHWASTATDPCMIFTQQLLSSL